MKFDAGGKPVKPNGTHLKTENALCPHYYLIFDPDGLMEFSVVYTDRSLNHMSKRFGGVMRDIGRYA